MTDRFEDPEPDPVESILEESNGGDDLVDDLLDDPLEDDADSGNETDRRNSNAR